MFEVEAYLFVNTKGPALQEAWYGWVLECVNKKGELKTREDFGQVKDTGNRINIKALGDLATRLKAPCRIHLHTNSHHLESVITNGWLKEWAVNNWNNSSGKEIKNRELWEETWKYLENHEITASYETEHSYSDWIKREIKTRQEKDRDWEDSRRQMVGKIKGENAGEPNKY